MLLRNGYRYGVKTSWSAAHLRYLRELILPHTAMKIVLQEYLQCIDATVERIERLEVQMKALLDEWHMKPVGLVPSESNSRGSRTQGSITKCGNGHLRWIFNECAQHYRLPPKVSPELDTRQEAIPKAH